MTGVYERLDKNLEAKRREKMNSVLREDKMDSSIHTNCLVDKQECAWQLPEQKPPFKDAAWASNEDDRRSLNTMHLFFGRALLETSTCTQQVTALSSGESEFYGVLTRLCTASTAPLPIRSPESFSLDAPPLTARLDGITDADTTSNLEPPVSTHITIRVVKTK